MANKQNLTAAKAAKKDEFYTQLSDIEDELRHYKEHFRGKVVFCNCDDPFESNFFKYFVLNFNHLGLKKVIATCYAGSQIANKQLSLFDVIGTEESKQNKPYKAIVTKVYDKTGDGGIDMLDVAELFKSGENELIELDGDGDFRSEECLALLDEADIVVTNPPFSLFREYVNTLVEHGKKFIIIGSINAITYKTVFPLLMDDKVWFGYSKGSMSFRVPDEYQKGTTELYTTEDGKKWQSMGNVTWYTNLDTKQRHEQMILFRRYSPDKYPTYDNYAAINIDKACDIPCDYPGIMGVPITFMDKYCPEQFEIVGITKAWWGGASKIYPKQTQIDKKGNQSIVTKLNDAPSLYVSSAPLSKTYYRVDNKCFIALYARILIRNKFPEVPKGGNQ